MRLIRPVDESMKKQVRQWLNFSKVDLDSAAKLLEEPGLTQSAAFHCQQAIEKSFKAVLEDANAHVPRTHDLEKLLGLIASQNISFDIDEEILDKINDVYIDIRYPSDLGLIPDGIPKVETVQVFYDLSKSIYNQILDFLMQSN